jgi:GNAT superfamily N-acetyltransferase
VYARDIGISFSQIKEKTFLEGSVIAGDMRIRFARASDAEGIRALCRAAEGEDDYIIHIFEEWFRPRYTVVAEAGGKIIGMVKGKPLIDGSIWLGGARVHPDYRGRGIAGELTRYRVDAAARRGVKRFAALISRENKASIRAIRKAGFDIGLVVAILVTGQRGEDEDTKIPLSKISKSLTREEITREDIYHSGIIKKMNRRIGLFYEFPVLNETTASLISDRGRVFSFGGRGKFILTPNTSRTWMTVQIIRDHPSLPRRVAQLILANSPGAGLFLPRDQTLISRYRRAGFTYATWASTANVMELLLE